MELIAQKKSLKNPHLQSEKSALEINGNNLNHMDLNNYANNKSSSRLGLLFLFVGLTGFLLWAGFAPLDEGVPTEGIVNIENNHKVVQHLSGGIVKTLAVSEGREVKAGMCYSRLMILLLRPNMKR